MKRYSIVALLIVLLIASQVEVWHVRANEYFGDGVMLVAYAGERRFAGVIMAWGWYWISGTLEDCRIVPLYSPVGDAATVQCGLIYNKKSTVFRGWYDFRGHPRPICGALDKSNIPHKCKGE